MYSLHLTYNFLTFLPLFAFNTFLLILGSFQSKSYCTTASASFIPIYIFCQEKPCSFPFLLVGCFPNEMFEPSPSLLLYWLFRIKNDSGFFIGAEIKNSSPSLIREIFCKRIKLSKGLKIVLFLNNTTLAEQIVPYWMMWMSFEAVSFDHGICCSGPWKMNNRVFVHNNNNNNNNVLPTFWKGLDKQTI